MRLIRERRPPACRVRRPAEHFVRKTTPHRLVRTQVRGRKSSPGRRRPHAGRVRSPFVETVPATWRFDVFERAVDPLLVALAGWLFSTGAFAGDVATAFDAANKLYEEGKYAGGGAALQKLVQSGLVSDTLYFNLGNACYKAGQNGRAIAAYRQAERLAPRDPSVRFNLQFVRKKVNGNDNVPGRWWQRWLSRLTLNEWTMLTTSSLWLWFLLLALIQWRRELKRTLRSCINIFGTASGLLAVCLGTALYDYYFNQPAIVIAREAVVRNGPLDESQSAYSVQDGMELTVLDQKDDWLQVSDARQRIGWLKRTEVLLLKPNV